MKSTPTHFLTITLAAIFLATAATGQAGRKPVLQQIEVPHHYYYREMFLPQVSSGPQSPAWSPDGQSLVYAMQGSLWRQSIDSTTATQLTAGPAYDHQPDWSPDGKRIVFSRYHEDAVDLHVLDIESGVTTQLTSGGDVNVEPRWSPDGSRLAFVSTKGTGRFQVFVGTINNGSLSAARVFPDRKSKLPRYYYDEYDHEIHPTWSPDGASLIYVANPEVPYGSGSIWQYALDGASQPELLRQEETTWRAKPDVAPDGRRLVYSSYLGRQWHQLWLLSISGVGEPFPLTYGDFDATNAQWSPDGERIAFSTNENGNTGIRILELPGGKLTDLVVSERNYLRPTGTLALSVVASNGDVGSARVSVVATDGRAYAPHDSWMHADDSFDRAQRDEEARYFHVHGAAAIDVPAGEVAVTVWHGPESTIEHRSVEVKAGQQSEMQLNLARLDLPADWRDWYSGDVHVHMNYGGIYRNSPESLVRQAEAEDLDVVFNLIVNKEQRVPDVVHFTGESDDASNDNVVLQHSQEFHTGFWGHLGLLGLTEHLLMPDYSAYPETGAASLYPDNVTVENMAHAQGAIAGYVHPFEYPLPDPAKDSYLTNALPIDAALGLVDFYEVVGFADHRASAEVWYRLLNNGFRIAAAGGTDAMANFASLRGPVGMNRTYVHVENWVDDANGRHDAWVAALRAGKSIATNGPLLGLSVDGASPGATLSFDVAGSVSYSGFMRSAVPLDKVELVMNGSVVRDIELSDDRMSADFSGEITVAHGSWLLLRASADGPHPEILDMYPYATTSPVYMEIGGVGPRSEKDEAYLIAWARRVRQAAATHRDYNSNEERQKILNHIDRAIEAIEVGRSNK